MEEQKKLIPLFHESDREEESELFINHDSPDFYPRVFIPTSNAAVGKPVDVATSGMSRRELLTISPSHLLTKEINADFTLGPTTQYYSTKLPRASQHSEPTTKSRILNPKNSQIDSQDELAKLIDERIRRMFSYENQSPQKDDLEEGESVNSIFSKESDLPDLKINDWNTFVVSMASRLGIECSNSEKIEEDKSYMSNRLLPTQEVEGNDIPLDGAIIRALKRIDREWLEKQKIRCLRNEDNKKYSVTQQHKEDYCTAPVLDLDVEEGIIPSKKKVTNNKRYTFSSKTAETTNICLKKLDSGARLLLKQISYGTLMASYLDNLQSEESRQETIKHISNVFLDMADTVSRLVISSVTARRSLYLRDMQFQNKMTENRLLNLSALGPNLFGGKFFEILHGSAENLRDARETQNVRFRQPTSGKRHHDSSYVNKTEFVPPQKKSKFDFSGSFRNKKEFHSFPQRGKPEFRKSRSTRGTGFRPNTQ